MRNLSYFSQAVLVLSVLLGVAGGQDSFAQTRKQTRSLARDKALAKPKRAKIENPVPDVLIAARTVKVLTQLKSRPVRSLTPSANLIEVSTSASKSGFLQTVYAQKLVDATWATEMLADKRIFSEVLKRELGTEKANALYPKTLGLREFLFSRKFLNPAGQLDRTSAEEIEAALFEEFPNGFVVRAAVGVSPRETSQGLFATTDAFINELLKPETALYRPTHATQAVTSHILGSVASGEAVVLQENIVAAADARKPLKNRFFQEVRVHIYESKVVEGAVPKRWVQRELLDSEEIAAAEGFVRGFLRELPTSMLTRQAWSVDVAVLDNGEMRISDVVTNRGGRTAWSSYLDQPNVIAAYAKHFESHTDVRFIGFSGFLVRNGFANYFTYWGLRIDKARPGLMTVLAYLPPWPFG